MILSGPPLERRAASITNPSLAKAYLHPYTFPPLATNFHHPSRLNPWQLYRQASSVLRNTSRAKNPAWYQSALELDLQLHIRPDGPSVFCAYFNRKTSIWAEGPALSDDLIRNEEAYESLITEIISYARKQGASSLGIILHVANEFATTELKPELDNPAALPELRKAAYDDPTAILEDSSVDKNQAAWRVVPYAASNSETIGTTITLTSQLSPLFDAFRAAGERSNFPVITLSLSAPLITIMGLPQLLSSQPSKPFVTILQYPWFTVLAFFNEHADLRLIRTLQHRGVRRAANLRNAVSTTSASLEFMDPDLFIIPLGKEVDDSLEGNLQAYYANCTVATLRAPSANGVPPWCPEVIIASNALSKEAQQVTSLTFTSFRDDQWALQDFLPTPKEVVEVYPSKSEMALMRVSKIMKLGVTALTLAGLAYFGLGIFQLTRKEEWQFNPDKATITKNKLSMLSAERASVDYWNSMLADRSKAWVEMESIARLFPEKGGMLIKTCSYSAKPDSTPGKSTIGFVKSWKISGLARDEAQDFLNSLNTRDGINAHFANIAKLTGNEAYDPSLVTRNIAANVRIQENNAFRPVSFEEMILTDESTYPFTFDLTITQRFESTDPMAINVPKAP